MFVFWCLMNNMTLWTNVVCWYTRYSSNSCKVDTELGKYHYLKQYIINHLKTYKTFQESNTLRIRIVNAKTQIKVKPPKLRQRGVLEVSHDFASTQIEMLEL